MKRISLKIAVLIPMPLRVEAGEKGPFGVWYVFPGGREDTIDLSLTLQESEGLGNHSETAVRGSRGHTEELGEEAVSTGSPQLLTLAG